MKYSLEVDCRGSGCTWYHIIRLDPTIIGTEGQTGRKKRNFKEGFLFCDVFFPRKTRFVDLSIRLLSVCCYMGGGGIS